MDRDQADALNGAIRLISIKHRGRAHAKLAALGLYPGQESVLQLLDHHGPQTQRQLAAGAGCEPPSITAMVRKLETSGLVSRHPSEQDARAIQVSLTDASKALIPALNKLWTELADETVACLRTTTTDQLIHVLTDLARGLQSQRPASANTQD